MNKQLKTLLIIIGILIVFLAVKEVLPKMRQEESQYVLSLRDVPKESVTSVLLSEDKESVLLKREGNDWKAGEKKADSSKIEGLLTNLYPLTPPETVSASKERFGEFGIEGDSLLSITINDKVKLIIGKSGAYGTYARIDGKDFVFALKDFSTTMLTPTVGNWADKKIIAVERTKIKQLTFVTSRVNLTIVKKDDKWIKDGTDTEIAKDKMDNVLLTLGSFVATTLATTEEISNYPKVPEIKLTIEEDVSQTLEMYKGENDYLIKRNSDGELFKSSLASVNSLSSLVE